MKRMRFLNKALNVALILLVIGCTLGSFPSIASASSPPTSPPTHISPANGATGVSLTPTFIWSSVSGATRYGLYVADTRTGALVFDSQARGISIPATSYTLPSGILVGGVTYRWNMKAGNAAGWGPFSTARTFTTSPPPTPTFSVSGRVTSGGAGLSGVTMSFSRVSGAGNLPASVVANGNWSQTGFQSGTTYRVTPARTGFTFTPASIDFIGARADLNFTALSITVKPVAPLKITDTNLALLASFPNDAYYTVGRTDYLYWNYGQKLDVTQTSKRAKTVQVADGTWKEFVEIADNNGNYRGECVSFAKALSKNISPTGDWGKGQHVVAGGIARGTVIATFSGENQKYTYSDHAAVFKDYIRNQEGKIIGFEVWDQNWAPPTSPYKGIVGKHNLERSGSGVGNCDNYYVVMVPK